MEVSGNSNRHFVVGWKNVKHGVRLANVTSVNAVTVHKVARSVHSTLIHCLVTCVCKVFTGAFSDLIMIGRIFYL